MYRKEKKIIFFVTPVMGQHIIPKQTALKIFYY
jgi:hypothetical protein